MKIVLVGPVFPYRGGIAHYTTLLAKKLGCAGHDTSVVSFKRQYPQWLYPGKTDKDISLQPLSTEAAFLLDPLKPWTWINAFQSIAAKQPDLVLVMWWSTFWAPAFSIFVRLLQARGIRTAYLIHNVYPHEARFYDRWLAQIALSSTQIFLVQTNRQGETLRSFLPQAQVFQAAHPVYDMFAGKQVNQGDARKQLHLPDDGIVLLFFGIVRAYKGLPHLIEAAAILKQRGIKVNVLVAGEFWEAEETYRQQAERLAIADHLFIVNQYIANEQLAVYFSASDLFVAPYIGGTQSGAINMALGFHLPVVMSDVIAESVSPGLRGFCKTVPPADPVSLANTIEEMLIGKKENMNMEQVDQESWVNLIKAIEHMQGKP